MELIIIIGIVAILALALSLVALSRLGRFVAENEQRAYVQNVLHAVETRGEFDREQRNR